MMIRKLFCIYVAIGQKRSTVVQVVEALEQKAHYHIL